MRAAEAGLPPPRPTSFDERLLGVLHDVGLGAALVTLEAGDTLVFFTDEVIEARGDGAMFGVEGVRAAMEPVPAGAAALAQAVENAVLGHTGGVVTDDLAVLVLQAAA